VSPSPSPYRSPSKSPSRSLSPSRSPPLSGYIPVSPVSMPQYPSFKSPSPARYPSLSPIPSPKLGYSPLPSLSPYRSPSKSPSRSPFPSPYPYRYPSPSPIPSSPILPSIPQWPFGGRGSGKARGGARRGFGYDPNLTAKVFGVRGKAPKGVLQGVAFRPLPLLGKGKRGKKVRLF